MNNTALMLKDRGIRPTMHRLAVAKVLLPSRDHLSADEVWARVKKQYPAISRATVYNTLDLFSEKGLVRRRMLKQDSAVYDPVIQPHHHLVEESTGRVYDIPWEAVKLPLRVRVPGFEVEDFHLVIKGKKKK
jgi:Fur family transcriptional regulator, iron response regulator